MAGSFPDGHIIALKAKQHLLQIYRYNGEIFQLGGFKQFVVSLHGELTSEEVCVVSCLAVAADGPIITDVLLVVHYCIIISDLISH